MIPTTVRPAALTAPGHRVQNSLQVCTFLTLTPFVCNYYSQTCHLHLTGRETVSLRVQSLIQGHTVRKCRSQGSNSGSLAPAATVVAPRLRRLLGSRACAFSLASVGTMYNRWDCPHRSDLLGVTRLKWQSHWGLTQGTAGASGCVRSQVVPPDGEPRLGEVTIQARGGGEVSLSGQAGA